MVTHEQEKLAQKVVDFKVRHFKEGIHRVALNNPLIRLRGEFFSLQYGSSLAPDRGVGRNAVRP
jgi:hypothetical protein